jgi:hypothetical protein
MNSLASSYSCRSVLLTMTDSTIAEEQSKPHDTESSIRTTYRAGRTRRTQLIHGICRLLRNQLARPSKEQPRGSIQLQPPKKITRNCDISERVVEDIHIYDIQPHSESDGDQKRATRRIYYFCGGGWQSPPSNQHCSSVQR